MNLKIIFSLMLCIMPIYAINGRNLEAVVQSFVAYKHQCLANRTPHKWIDGPVINLAKNSEYIKYETMQRILVDFRPEVITSYNHEERGNLDEMLEYLRDKYRLLRPTAGGAGGTVFLYELAYRNGDYRKDVPSEYEDGRSEMKNKLKENNW